MTEEDFSQSPALKSKCGYVAFAGLPNSGKSTLLNSCIGHKIAGVSAKQQTTRSQILGVCQHQEAQILFVDTPGLHHINRGSLRNTMMNKTAWSAIADADIICYLVDSSKGWRIHDSHHLQQLLRSTTAPILVLASKKDRSKKADVKKSCLDIHDKISELISQEFPQQGSRIIEPLPLAISAKQADSIKAFIAKLADLLPLGPWLYDEDALTSLSTAQLVAEHIREQIYRLFSKEIPYGCGVIVEAIKESEKLVKIHAVILVARSSYKPIILGNGGQQLKKIGTQARATLERHFDKQVYLNLFVKVEPQWHQNAKMVAQIEGLTLDESEESSLS